MVGAVLPADGLPRPLGHPEFHPLYEEAESLGLHARGAFAEFAAQQRSVHVARRSGDAGPCLAADAPVHQLHVFRRAGQISGSEDRFLEAGCGWVPYLMSKMGNRMGEAPRPAKLIERGQIYFQCGEEMTTSRDLELLGDECLFWASDFPHEGIVGMKKAVDEFLEREDIPKQRNAKSATTIRKGFTRSNSAVPFVQGFQMFTAVSDSRGVSND